MQIFNMTGRGRRPLRLCIIPLIAGPVLGMTGLPRPGMAHSQLHGPNGGPVADAGGYHLELVGSGLQLAVYMSDGKTVAMPVDGVSGRAVILASGSAETIALAAREPGRLTGRLQHELATDDRVAIAVKLAGGREIQAQFKRN